jgi:PAS domain S-box-containing protein
MQDAPKNHPQRIALTAGAIVIAAGVLTGLCVFFMMQAVAGKSLPLANLLALLAGVTGAALLALRWLLGSQVAGLVQSEAAATQRADALALGIAEHRQANAELLGFRRAVDDTLDMIFMLVPQTFRFAYVNQGAVSSIGYSREEFLAMTCCQITPHLSKFKFRQGIASVLSGEQAFLRFDTQCRRKDGTEFAAAVFMQLVTQRDATPLLVATMRDITERKKAEQMKTDLISVLYKKNSEGVTVADSDGTIISVNPAFTKITGYTQKDVVGKNANILSSGRHDKPFYKAMWNEINTAGQWGGEIWNRRKDGELYLQWITINAIFHDDGTVYRYVGMFSDISRKRQAKIETDALRHSSQMKSEFLANMSHELRTPLNAIIGFSEVFKEGLLGSLTEEQSKYIGHVFDSGKYLLSLINDILDLSKVEAGEMVLDLEPVDLLSMFENSLLIIKGKAVAHHIVLRANVADDIGKVLADARKVKQIVYNLLSNAVKFSNEGGTVTLQARRVPRAEVGKLTGLWPGGRCFALADNAYSEFLEIRATDCGIGISSAGMEKLFRPFSQIESSLSRRFEGTGLGLVMIKNLTELHGGTLSLESAEGQGSRFTVWLPLRSAQEAVAPLPAPVGEEWPAPEPLAFISDKRAD